MTAILDIAGKSEQVKEIIILQKLIKCQSSQQ